MNSGSTLLCCAVLCAAAVQPMRAAEVPVASSECPLAHTAPPVRYERVHQIPTEPAPDDPAGKMITPGGMILETPRMVEATDRLTITARDASALCFELLTLSRDRSRCEIRGTARLERQGSYVFRDGEASLRLLLRAPDEIRVEPRSQGIRKFCEPSGRIVRVRPRVGM